MSEQVKPRTENSRLAYRVDEALALLPFGRNKFYDEVNAGRLKIRKIGRMTIVLADELEAYLKSLPFGGADAAA